MLKTKPPRPAKPGDAKPPKKRRPSQKKKEDEPPPSRKRSIGGVALASLLQEEHRRVYQRAPRLLPEIHGVRALSGAEIASDLKALQASLAGFESKLALAGAHAGAYVHGNKESASANLEEAYGFLVQKRRARATGVITPEEVVESLPVCRRAVRITQRELAAMKRERDDLERDFMRQRCKLLWQMGEMKRIQKQQDKVLRVLASDVVHTAKSLASSRRRTNALQDIMTELDARGSAVMRLTREKHQLETLLKKHGIELPEPDELYVGDRVATTFGNGTVTDMDDVKRVVAVALENGAGTAYVQEETVEVLPAEISYAETEKELKNKLFEKVGALVQHNGRFGFLAGGGRRRSRSDLGDDSDGDYAGDALDNGEADDDDEDEEDDDEPAENGVGDGDEEYAGRRSGADADPDYEEEGRKRPAKKRKLMVAAASAKKKHKNGKVFDFTACKIPITPYDSGLLLSPLSVLPERVAAVGPGALQWLSSYLPAKMADWEQDRYHALQMQGEIERLKFQLQKAEDDKEDAHSLAVEQVDSMNDLVRQIEKLREQLAAKEAKEKETNQSCPNCSSSSTASSKKATAGGGPSKQTKANGRGPGGKASNRRQRSESMEADDDDTEGSSAAEKDSSGTKRNSRDDSDGPEDSDSRKEDAHADDDDYGDDGNESSDASKPATRSLRPRRGSATSQSSKASK